MVKVAVVLSGCGYLDGAEIRESVLALTSLDKHGAKVSIFAPNIPQRDVINHLTGAPANEKRNVLEESARIARGKIKDLNEAKAEDFDALVLPGGFGVAKNLSDLAVTGASMKALPEFKALILDFLTAHKPIGAICISPAILTGIVKEQIQPHVTIGKDVDGLIASLGGVHQECPTQDVVIDENNHIVSTSAYMRDDASLADIATGIDRLVENIIRRAAAQKKAA